jgi:hypothetical protein
MDSKGGRFPRGKRGSTTRIAGQDGKSFEHDPKEEQFKPDKDMTGPLASVGMSLSVGASTEYAREKYEIAAWCTLPCKPVEADILETYEVCYDFCVKEIDRRRDEVEKVVFPHGMGRR